MSTIIIVTEKEYYKAEEVFKSSHDLECIPVSSEEDKLSSIISGKSAFGCILGTDSYKDQLYETVPKAGIIARFGVGHDGIDKIKATEHGIIVTNTPEVLDDSVAEHAIFLMGALSRNIVIHNQNMKTNSWSPDIGSELKGKSLLILGCGSIGKKTARIASFGFGMNVIGCDISDLDADQLRREFGITQFVNDFNEVIQQADIISIHLPLLQATRHLINAEFLSKLKCSAYVINTSRGPVVDEIALYDAVKQKNIAGAALDVFENEPFNPVKLDKNYRSLDNVILTPHVASSTVEACQRMAVLCMKNIKWAINKDYDQLNILNPEVLKN